MHFKKSYNLLIGRLSSNACMKFTFENQQTDKQMESSLSRLSFNLSHNVCILNIQDMFSAKLFFAVSASWWSFHHVLYKKKDTIVYKVFPGNLRRCKITLHGPRNCLQRWRKATGTCYYCKHIFTFNMSFKIQNFNICTSKNRS